MDWAWLLWWLLWVLRGDFFFGFLGCMAVGCGYGCMRGLVAFLLACAVCFEALLLIPVGACKLWFMLTDPTNIRYVE